MASRAEVRERALSLVAKAEALIPERRVPDLAPMANHPDVPEWHGFEWEVWEIGEQIRQLLVEHPALRKDRKLQEGFVRISTNAKAKRGRQSFVILLGFKSCQVHAATIATQIGDPAVTGHVISTLTKMRAGGFADTVRPYVESNVTWIRNEAKKYMARYNSA